VHKGFSSHCLTGSPVVAWAPCSLSTTTAGPASLGTTLRLTLSHCKNDSFSNSWHRPKHVDIELTMELILGDLFQRYKLVDAGIIHQHVKRAEGLLGFVKELPYIAGFGDVALYRNGLTARRARREEGASSGMRTSADASVHAHGPSLITTHASVIDLVLSMEKVSVRSTLA
jgi:hypothetical protein